MKNLLLGFVLAMAVQGATLTLDETTVRARPGQVADWTFVFQPDTAQWVSVTGSFLTIESNPTLGFYSDEIGLLGGPDGRLAPNSEPWRGVVGYYFVDPTALLGQRNDASLRVEYEIFSADPATCSNCLVGQAASEFRVAVEVADEIPEPGTWTMFVTGAALLGWRWRRRRS